MASWKDKFSKFLDNLSEPIDGFRDDTDSGRGEPLFKKGDKVITWDNEKGTVTRKMEYGDGWAYGLKLDSGKLVKAMKQKDLKHLKETRQMKIKLSELRKVIREELNLINEVSVGFNDPKVGSWVKFVGRMPEYHDELEMMWDLMTSGSYNKDALQNIPSELHGGVRFHAMQINRKAQEGASYPSWDEVLNELQRLIDKQKQNTRKPRLSGYRSNPRYQAASDSERQRWHQYGGDPDDPRNSRGLGT